MFVRDFVVFQGASGWTLAERGRLVLSLVSGPGSDLSEEPVFQDASRPRWTTESFLSVLPGPTLFSWGRLGGGLG